MSVQGATAVADTINVSRGNNGGKSGGVTNPPILINGQKLTQKQLEMAYVQLSGDGKSYIITPREDIPVEILKETFGIEDGAFREILKEQYKGGLDNGVFVEEYSRFFGLSKGNRYNYTRALLYNDKKYTIPIEKVHPSGN